MHDAAAVAGRAFIVHGRDGGRIACALLGEGATLSAGPFAPYPGYTGDLAVSGAVTQMITVGTTQTFDLSFTGLDTDCEFGAGTAGNSCGVHIHSGYSCDDASLVGGHYFTGDVASDPWTAISYTSDSNGDTADRASVTTGATAAGLWWKRQRESATSCWPRVQPWHCVRLRKSLSCASAACQHCCISAATLGSS